jgi:magnesium chelatase family protein
MGSVTFPADLMMVAALNPCPCGYRGDPRRACNCSPIQIEKYVGKISGPLLDRIDIHLEVAPVPFRELSDKTTGTGSAEMRKKVVAAREIQKQRFQGDRNTLNGRMNPRQIRKHCKLDSAAESILKTAMEEMGLSARAHDKILRPRPERNDRLAAPARSD